MIKIRIVKENGYTVEVENTLEAAAFLNCSVDYICRLIVGSKKLPKSISSIEIIKE